MSIDILDKLHLTDYVTVVSSDDIVIDTIINPTMVSSYGHFEIPNGNLFVPNDTLYIGNQVSDITTKSNNVLEVNGISNFSNTVLFNSGTQNYSDSYQYGVGSIDYTYGYLSIHGATRPPTESQKTQGHKFDFSEGPRIQLFNQSERASSLLGCMRLFGSVTNNSNSKLIIDNFGGGVGVGTSAPKYTLDVNGTFGISGNATISGNLSLAGTAETRSLSINTSSLTPGYILDVNGGAKVSYLAINSTTSYGYWLYVDGDSYINGSLSTNGDINLNGTGKRIYGNFSTNTYNNRLAFQSNVTGDTSPVTAVSAIPGYGYSSPDNTLARARFDVYNNSDLNTEETKRFGFVITNERCQLVSDVIKHNSVNSYVSFPISIEVNDNTAAYKGIWINGSEYSANTGYVGINTSSPERELDVNGSVSVKSKFFVPYDTSYFGSQLSTSNKAIDVVNGNVSIQNGELAVNASSVYGGYNFEVRGDAKCETLTINSSRSNKSLPSGYVLDVTGTVEFDGDINITGVGRRIKGEFSSSSNTNLDRVFFQTSNASANSVTAISVIPGTGSFSEDSQARSRIDLYNYPDIDNGSHRIAVAVSNDLFKISSTRIGRSNQERGVSLSLPISIETDDFDSKDDTYTGIWIGGGKVGVNTKTPNAELHVNGDLVSKNVICESDVSVTNVSAAGNLYLNGTGKRIYGNFSATTSNNRIAFQSISNVSNPVTAVGAIPGASKPFSNNTAARARFDVFNNSDLNTEETKRFGFVITNERCQLLSDVISHNSLNKFVSFPISIEVEDENNSTKNCIWINGSEYSANTGYVGINTSSPQYNLDVAGNTAISGNLSLTGSAKRILGDFTGSGTTPISKRLMFQTNVTGEDKLTAISVSPGIGSYNPGSVRTRLDLYNETPETISVFNSHRFSLSLSDKESRIESEVVNDESGIVDTLPIVIATDESRTTLKGIRINGSESNHGFVGIGTLDPQYDLDVNGTFGVSGDTAIGGNLKISGTGKRIYGMFTGDISARVAFQSNSEVTNPVTAVGAIPGASDTFNADTVARARFDVYNDYDLDTEETKRFGIVITNERCQLVSEVIKHNSINSYVSFPISIEVNDNTAAYKGIWINGSEYSANTGFVGINTSSPQYNLDVNGSFKCTNLYAGGTAPSAGYLSYNGSSYSWKDIQQNSYVTNNYNADSVAIKPTSVAINTSTLTSGYVLDVNGKSNFSGAITLDGNLNITNGKYIQSTDDSGKLILAGGNGWTTDGAVIVLGGANNIDSGGVFNSNMCLYGTNSSASKLTMTGFGGGVGIGTTTPTSGFVLDVNGNAKCSKLAINSTSLGDYVLNVNGNAWVEGGLYPASYTYIRTAKNGIWENVWGRFYYDNGSGALRFNNGTTWKTVVLTD